MFQPNIKSISCKRILWCTNGVIASCSLQKWFDLITHESFENCVKFQFCHDLAVLLDMLFGHSAAQLEVSNAEAMVQEHNAQLCIALVSRFILQLRFLLSPVMFFVCFCLPACCLTVVILLVSVAQSTTLLQF